MRNENLGLGVFICAIIASVGVASAEPSKRPSTSAKTKSSGNTVKQVYSPEVDGWESSTSSYREWPRLGQEDCARYGARYGYSECAGAAAPRKIPERKVEDGEASTPSVQAIKTTINAKKVLKPAVKPEQKLLSVKSPRLKPPLPERRPDTVVWLRPATKQDDVKPATVMTDETSAAISQILVMSFDGDATSSEGVQAARRQLEENLASNVIITPSNIKSFNQTKTLIASLKKARQNRGGLTAIEFSGGKFAPDASGFKTYAAPVDIGKSNEPLTAHDFYRGLATDLAALGFDFNFSPVLSLEQGSETHDYSFGASPLHAASFASAFVHGHMDAGVVTALSHVPLTAATTGDADATFDLQAASPVYREIFKKDLGYAVTVRGEGFAKSIRMLREDLGFSGVIVVSFLASPSAADDGWLEKASVEAVSTGADLLLVKSSPKADDDQVSVAAKALKDATVSGQLTRERLNAANANVDGLRRRMEATLEARRKRDFSTTRNESAQPNVKSN